MLCIALMSGEDLRQAAILEDLSGFKDGASQLLHLGVQSVTREGQHENRILDRPYRSAMIRKWIECRMIRGERAHSPTREHIRLHDAIGDASSERIIDDARSEAMSRIGSD